MQDSPNFSAPTSFPNTRKIDKGLIAMREMATVLGKASYTIVGARSKVQPPQGRRGEVSTPRFGITGHRKPC